MNNSKGYLLIKIGFYAVLAWSFILAHVCHAESEVDRNEVNVTFSGCVWKLQAGYSQKPGAKGEVVYQKITKDEMKSIKFMTSFLEWDETLALIRNMHLKVEVFESAFDEVSLVRNILFETHPSSGARSSVIRIERNDKVIHLYEVSDQEFAEFSKYCIRGFYPSWEKI